MRDPITERHATLAARIRELEADLARVTEERDASTRSVASTMTAYDALAAKLARAEGLLRGFMPIEDDCGEPDCDDCHAMRPVWAYFAEQEPIVRECKIDEASEACIDRAEQRALDVTQDMAHWLHRWPGGAPNEAWSALSTIIAALREQEPRT